MKKKLTIPTSKNIGTENQNKAIESNINKYSTKPVVLENKQNITLAFDDKSELVKINNQISGSINDKNENKKFKKKNLEKSILIIRTGVLALLKLTKIKMI